MVQRCNEELQQARAGWHRAERELRLHVVPASSLRAVDAALTAPSLGAGAPLSDIEGAREVVVPRGTTQNGLVQAVADAFEGSGDGVPSPPHRIRLHRLQRCLSGLHMYEPLPPWGGDVREVASGSVVVAWDGEHVGAGDHAQAGSHCEPLTVQVTSLEEEVGPEGGRHSVPLTIARNTSMSDLRARVAAAARLTLHHRMSIHLVRETPGDAGRTGKAKCEAVRLPAKLGWGEQLGDFGVGHGSELLVEVRGGGCMGVCGVSAMPCASPPCSAVPRWTAWCAVPRRGGSCRGASRCWTSWSWSPQRRTPARDSVAPAPPRSGRPSRCPCHHAASSATSPATRASCSAWTRPPPTASAALALQGAGAPSSAAARRTRSALRASSTAQS